MKFGRCNSGERVIGFGSLTTNEYH